MLKHVVAYFLFTLMFVAKRTALWLKVRLRSFRFFALLQFLFGSIHNFAFFAFIIESFGFLNASVEQKKFFAVLHNSDVCIKNSTLVINIFKLE